jgi:hypothetical protein
MVVDIPFSAVAPAICGVLAGIFVVARGMIQRTQKLEEFNFRSKR